MADSAEIRRPPLSKAEWAAVAIATVGMVVLGIYGFIVEEPSTFGYLFSVVAVGALIAGIRRRPLSSGLAIAVGIAAVAHLAGGLVQVGTGVLYDASVGPITLHTHVIQYDHFAHAFGSFVAVLVIWELLVPEEVVNREHINVLVLVALASMGVGALNELIEFIATLADQGAHVGGYNNTGWDFVSNLVGAILAACFLRLRAHTTQAHGV